MKNDALIRDICESYCSFYKPGKDENMACMGLLVLQKLLELRNGVPDSGSRDHLNPETAERLFNTLCAACPFAASDCDYAEWKRGRSENVPDRAFVPCGGFIFIGSCIDHGTLDHRELDHLI